MPVSLKGKDLFDSMIWKDPASTSVFYQFIASLRRSIYEEVKQTTAAHGFIRTLRDRRKLVRCYTQNIDGLEAQHGLSTDLTKGQGARSRFSKKALEMPMSTVRSSPGGPTDGGCEIVQLHGNLKTVKCTLCQKTTDWDDTCHTACFLEGRAPICQSCITINQSRTDRGKRGTKIGTLRPNIILYGEEHPHAETIGTITSHDLSLSPDLLLILGTSLHVHGLKILVREFAKSVHVRPGGKGKVVFVNLSRPAESVWKGLIDYWICMDCDEWVAKMRKSRPDIWQVQGELQVRIKKSKTNKNLKGRTPPAGFVKDMEAEKENVILDSDEGPPSSSPMPKVVITTPRKTRDPLQAHGTTQRLFFGNQKQSIECVIPDSDPQSSLPTPPMSSAATPTRTTRKRKPLTEVYNEGCQQTPSKRWKSWVGIWADDSDAR